MTSSLLILWAWIALVAPGFVLAVRALPWVEQRMMEGKKPWVCDLCMSFWAVVVWGSLLSAMLQSTDPLLATPPSFFAALMLLQWGNAPPPGPPPTFGDL